MLQPCQTLDESRLFAWPEGLPLQATIPAFQRSVDVIVGAVTRARIGLGKRHLVVNMCVLMTEGTATGSTHSSCLLFAKPTLHKEKSPS